MHSCGRAGGTGKDAPMGKGLPVPAGGVSDRVLPLCGASRHPHDLSGGKWPPAFGVRPALPNFYARYAAELQTVYDLLADDASREVYAARIKALITGNAGYLPASEHEEYYHPVVRPEAGDIMLDGGVSDMVGAQRRFAQSVGRNGQVHGFEPIPWMAASARKSMADCPQYHLHAAGLGRNAGRFASSPCGIPPISASPAGKTPCCAIW